MIFRFNWRITYSSGDYSIHMQKTKFDFVKYKCGSTKHRLGIPRFNEITIKNGNLRLDRSLNTNFEITVFNFRNPIQISLIQT